MNVSRKSLRIFCYSLLTISCLLTASYVLLLSLIDLDTYKEQILAELRSSLNRPVSYDTGRLSFSFGPAVALNHVVIKEPDGSADFIKIETLSCRIELLPLLQKRLAMRGIVAKKPVIRLERRRDGSFNISDLLKSTGKSTPLQVRDIRLRNGDITFTDRLPQQEELITRLSKVDLALDDIGRGRKTGIRLSTTLGGGAKGSLELHGKLRLAPEGKSLDQSTLTAKVATRQLDLGHYWPYYQQYVPFKKILGSLNADGQIDGRPGEFTTAGELDFSGLVFDYQPVFKGALAPKSLKVKYRMEVTRSAIDVKALEVNLDGLKVNGSCAIRDYREADPRITAQAVTSTFDLKKFNQYIPYGIIVKHVAQWIEEHIRGGTYRLAEGSLDGRVSQILQMEKDDNYNVLHIKAFVEKGLVSYGGAVPSFNNIKGQLEMKGKDFILHGMSGSFGKAPLTLEGRITDYPLDKPSAYPFRMAISPGRDEISWLIGREKAAGFTYGGSSSLALTGDGYTTDYRLTGEWNLTPAAYSYSDLLAKQVGTPASMSFKGALTPATATLTAIRYTMGSLALDLSGRYHFSTPKGLELLLNTNPVNMETVKGMIPRLNRYQPAGMVRLALKGSTPDLDKTGLRWQGIVDLNNAAMQLPSFAKPLSAVNGAVTFGEDAMETSQLTARLGNTMFAGKGAISSFAPLAFKASFSTPRLDLTDFGLQHKKMPQLNRVAGDLFFRENSLVIKSLTGSLNRSQLAVKGRITDLKAPKADLVLSAAYLDIADLVLLGGFERKPGAATANGAKPAIRAVVRADAGEFNGTSFEKLAATVALENGRLQIQPLEALLLGGRLTANSTITTDSAPPRYQLDFKLTDAAAADTINIIGIDKREVTGTLSMEGNLTASGDSATALRKSAAGTVSLHAREGTLRQFPVLSKVFSILNVSQILKLQLPDMVSEGMPYNEINAVLKFKEGTVSTEDFFVASDAMNISVVGRNDYINDNLDLTLGIQPLQTVDKVVSRIPIVGWILTGKEKALITAYFEIKGKSAAPKVSAIPVKSMGKGILGIFKRVFQLPVKLVTDTGEVVLGN